MSKIGLLFGSFDPPHLGHLILAKGASNFVDEVWMIPAWQNPFKKESTCFGLRFEMLWQLLRDYENFDNTVFAINKEEALALSGLSTRTWNVIKSYYDQFPEDEFYVITTEETLDEMKHWENYEWIKENVKFILIGCTEWHIDVNIIGDWTPVFPIDIHSSNVRKMIELGGNPYPYITKSVYQIIKDYKLYGIS